MNGTLYHHGVKGQKWGVRRYQNSDGSLTEAGQKRQAKKELKQDVKEYRSIRKTDKVDDYLKSMKNKKGQDYVDKMLKQSNSITTKGKALGKIAIGMAVQYAIGATAVLAFTSFMDKRLGIIK